MREIKFRKWDSYHKTMNYNPGHEPGDIKVTLINDYFQEEMEDGEILMQYTGLKDQKGKEIYEGDVLNIFDPETEEIVRVTFDDGCFCAIGFLGDLRTYPIRHYLFRGFEIEVIGNIYENPELIK